MAEAVGSENTAIATRDDAWVTGPARDMAIIKELVGKDFKRKYRRSVLGIAWSVLNPLLMMAVQAVVFTQLMKRSDPTIPNFPIYLILGNTAWALMSSGTNEGMRSIFNSSALLKKVKITRWVFPVEKVLFAVVNYAFSMVAVFLVMLFFGWSLTPWALLFPLGLLCLTVFSIGISLALSALSVFFQDINHLWGVVLTAWMYLTPLFYSIRILPDFMKSLMRLNPMYLYVTFFRRIFLWQMFPGWPTIAGCIGYAVASLVIGYAIFHKTEDRFILFI